MPRTSTSFRASFFYLSFSVLIINRWKETVEDRISKLEEAIKQNTTQSSMITPTNAAVFQPLDSRSDLPSTSLNSLSAQTSGSVTLNLSCSLGAFPASSMSLTLGDFSANIGRNLDPLSCGIISQETAETLFTFYKNNLDPCIHHALNENDTLISTHTSSILLTTAICTVSAHCIGSKDYSALLNTLKAQVSDKVFSTNHTFDDIRALCIGALWLNEISTALNSLGEQVLHRIPATPIILIRYSRPYLHRTRSTQMHHQNATYKTSLLRPHPTVLVRLHMRPSQLTNTRTTPSHARLSLIKKTEGFSPKLLHQSIGSNPDQPGRAMVHQQSCIRHFRC